MEETEILKSIRGPMVLEVWESEQTARAYGNSVLRDINDPSAVVASSTERIPRYKSREAREAITTEAIMHLSMGGSLLKVVFGNLYLLYLRGDSGNEFLGAGTFHVL